MRGISAAVWAIGFLLLLGGCSAGGGTANPKPEVIPAAAWPQLGGNPQRSGLTSYPGPLAPAQAGPVELPSNWAFQPPRTSPQTPVEFSPIVIDGYGNSYFNTADVIYSLDRSGQVRWTSSVTDVYGSTPTGIDGDPHLTADSTPVIIENNIVAFLVQLHGIIAFDLEGNLLWDSMLIPFLSEVAMCGTEDLLLLLDRNRLYAFSADGDVVWTYDSQFDLDLEITPAVAANGNIFLMDENNTYIALDSGGNLDWQHSDFLSLASWPHFVNAGDLWLAPADNGLKAFDSAGNIAWRFNLEELYDPYFRTLAPAVTGSQLIIVPIAATDEDAALQGGNPAPTLIALNADGTVAWTSSEMADFTPARRAYVDGNGWIYLLARNGPYLFTETGQDVSFELSYNPPYAAAQIAFGPDEQLLAQLVDGTVAGF